MRVPWLADVLRAAGCRVVEQPGWKELRPDYNLLSLAGAPATLQGIVCHHTASPVRSTLATNLSVVTNGNGVAPGPIAQLMLWRDGTFYCIAAGKANHAGAGGPVGAWLPDTSRQSVGNDRLLGIEACNDGVGEPWAPAMLDAYELGVAAILRHLGLPVERAITHHEWAPTRKIDPAGPNGGRYPYLPGGMTWNGNEFRRAIAKRLSPPAPVPVPPDLEQEHEHMPSLAKKANRSAVWLFNDRYTRVHVNSEASLNKLTPIYGAPLILDESQDLNAWAPIVVGPDPGDV